MRRPLLALILAALIVPGSAGAADRDDGIPAPLRALLGRAVERGGPLPAGPSLGILTLLNRAGLLNAPPGETEGYLVCPPAPEMRVLTWPDLPAADDCDLTQPAVEAYVAKLLDNAELCRAHAQASFAAAFVAKADLDAQVDLLPAGGGSSSAIEYSYELKPESAGIPNNSSFTAWLTTLTNATQSLCAATPFDEIEAVCADLNQVLAQKGGSLLNEAQRADFHERLNEALADAADALADVNQGYALLVADAQSFLDNFSEEAACPERGGIAGLLARARALAAFRASLRASRAFELALRLREVHVYLWYEGRLVVLTAPAFVVARFAAAEEDPDR